MKIKVTLELDVSMLYELDPSIVLLNNPHEHELKEFCSNLKLNLDKTFWEDAMAATDIFVNVNSVESVKIAS